MGHSGKEIAGKLFITEYTVKNYLKEIFKRIGFCKRSERPVPACINQPSDIFCRQAPVCPDFLC
ncbi:MAG: hypothetical protein CVU55_05480 [Deltaproteobacteria bacterium HGW-Deltaproteobacteria-13]|jgi:hypothetical protein|nr:MAG: hypothetical protein CVU55_05480 [Deltaproteobacteria bacterium HGW-Deltaproteobacteria-13]